MHFSPWPIIRRLSFKWQNSYIFRTTVTLSLALAILLSSWAAIVIYVQIESLRDSFKGRGLAVARTFSTIGGAAVLGNLFRIQEAMEQYKQDPTLQFLEVIDEDNLIVASLDPTRIALEFQDPEWSRITSVRKESIVIQDTPEGDPVLIIVNPLLEEGESIAWVRLGFSLAELRDKQKSMVLGFLPLALALLGLVLGGIHFSFRKFSPILEHLITKLEQAQQTFKANHSLPPSKQDSVFASANVSEKGQVERLSAMALDTAELLMIQTQSLQDLNQTLEKKVEERTRDLLQATVALETKNQELEEARDKAIRASKAKATFLAMMSHEIRTPMNAVIGMTGLLMESHLSPDQQHLARTVKTSGEALLTIINDILDFSKFEAGKLEFDSIDFDVRVLLDEVLALLADKAGDKKLELTGIVFEDIPTALRGDSGRIRQILLNLIGNALKFTHAGEVSVQVLKLSETPDLVELRFQITDTGIGIPLETQKHLFQPFSQADGSTTRKFGGTGLGLAISKQLVEGMGGTIGIESQPGQGAMFWFTLKLGKQQGESVYTPFPLQGLRVCCVDDHPTNRFLLLRYCTDWGLDASIASTPQEAIEILESGEVLGKPFDVAILDMEMPEMDGMALARILRSNPKTRSVRLVLLSSLGQPGDLQLVRHAGFAASLSKPVRKTDLRHTLEYVMGLQDETREDPAPIPSVHHQPEEMAIIHQAKILVVDDNAVNRDLALLILQHLGYHAELAENGEEALHAFRHSTYDAILMDCQMPEMDGFEATREIRRVEAERTKILGVQSEEEGPAISNTPGTALTTPPPIPIIAMTANAMQGDREACLVAGMDDYVAKPIRPEDLQKILYRWIVAPRLDQPGDGQNDPSDYPTAQGPEETRTLVNLYMIDQLLEMGGQPMALKVVNQFLHDVRSIVEELQIAIATANAGSLHRTAHGLKGICLNMGVEGLADLALTLEQQGLQGDFSGSKDSCDQLRDEFRRVERYLSQVLSSPTFPSPEE